MPTSDRRKFGFNYDTMETKDGELTICNTVIDEKSGEVFLYLVYQYMDKVGNRRELTIPRVKLPLRSDQIPSIRIDETFALPSMREYSYYIRLQDNQLPICPFEGFSTTVDMTEVEDPCMIERVIEYAVKEMTQEEIEQKLGYKVKIVTDKEEISMHKKERGFFGLLLDFILTLATGGLWLIWILIRFLRNR